MMAFYLSFSWFCFSLILFIFLTTADDSNDDYEHDEVYDDDFIHVLMKMLHGFLYDRLNE